MFGKPIRIGKLFGIDLTVSWSFLVLVVVLSFYIAFQSPSFVIGLISGLLSLVILFGSVVAHELGHSLVARRLGVRIAEIELHFFGGAAKMASMPRTPRDEILIAAAGPLVSLGLAGISGLLLLAGLEAFGLIGGLALINVMLGTFNLIPALPTDGGRILRAALSIKYGNLLATKFAVKVARVATVALGIWAVATGNFFAIGVAIFLWMLGTRELRLAELLHRNGSFEGYGPYQHQSFDTQNGSSTSLVEIYDRDGRFIGTAPGGVEQVGPAKSTRSSVDPTGGIWVVRHERPSWPA